MIILLYVIIGCSIALYLVKISQTSNIKKALEYAKVPYTMNGEQCWNSRYDPCPRYNGSYIQCSNITRPVPEALLCPCYEPNMKLCPANQKISEKRFFTKYKMPSTIIEKPNDKEIRIGFFNSKNSSVPTSWLVPKELLHSE